MSQTERIYWLDAELRAGCYPNPAALMAHFGVTERTAYDDHRYLRDQLHAPIATKRGRGWYYTDVTYALPFLALSETQAATLRRSLLAAQEYLDESDARIVSPLFDRLLIYLPERQRVDTLHAENLAVESLSGATHLTPAHRPAPSLLDACRRGARQRQKLWLRYHGAHRGEISERTVHPYHLHYYQSEPHLIAWCEEKQAIRHFHLARVLDWRLHDGEAAFTQLAGFDIETYLRRGLGAQHGEEPFRLRVRFSPYQARWIRERTYHASQQTGEQPDGGLILTMQVAGRSEVRRWLQTFGAEAEVIEPLDLRAEIAEEAKKLAQIYGAPEN